MKIFVRTLYIVVSLFAIAAGAYFGQQVPFKEQWPLYEALRNTAAIIFAVVGAWIALKFPGREDLGQARPEQGAALQRNGIGRYFTPIAHSIVVLCLILVIGFIAPIAKRLDFVQTNVDIFRGVSYSILVALTLFQLWTVLISLGPAAELKNEVDIANAEATRRFNRKRLGTFAQRKE